MNGYLGWLDVTALLAAMAGGVLVLLVLGGVANRAEEGFGAWLVRLGGALGALSSAATVWWALASPPH